MILLKLSIGSGGRMFLSFFGVMSPNVRLVFVEFAVLEGWIKFRPADFDKGLDGRNFELRFIALVGGICEMFSCSNSETNPLLILLLLHSS